MSRSSKLVSSLGSLALVGATTGVLITGPARAGEAQEAQPRVTTLASGLLSPLSLAIADNGTRYFTQNVAGLLNRQRPGQRPKVIYANTDGFEVGAVSEDNGRLRFALSKNNRRGTIMAMPRRGGKPYAIANLGKYERNTNPDGDVTYGFRKISQQCAAQMPQDGPPASYQGTVETHPYATLLAGGTTYVADAAANAIFAVPRPGKVRTVAVLPAVRAYFTAEAAQAYGFPDCVVGKNYWFEPVPTDVEMGPDGMLYVTTLAGGPEDGSAGMHASVYRVNPKNGQLGKVVGGMRSNTGLAVARNGDIYVAELFRRGSNASAFRGAISKVEAGAQMDHIFVKVPLPADVEVANGFMFATINALPGENDPPAGKLVRIRIRR